MFSGSDMQAMEGISRFLGSTMDRIGYGREIVELRRNLWDEFQMMYNKLPVLDEAGVKIVGSKAEGITSFVESDIDFMLIPDNVICTSNAEPFVQLLGMTMFQIDMTNTSPGYTKLKLLDFDISCISELQHSLFREESGEMFASSDFFKETIRRVARYGDHLSGPALSSPLHDFVIALYCICPNVLQSFETRRRQHDWPPSHITQNSCSDVCQLVPVGHKGSSEQWKEWRFCFVETELRLTRSLNDTQLKLYIVLKMIAKDILKCVTNEISSYIMKNITYWVSEQYGSYVFREENLMTLILIALRLLTSSIDSYYLPYFMIPGRNLLAERLEAGVRRNLSGVISQLLDEGPQLLLRCTKLREGMIVLYRSPRLLDDYKRKKELRELITMRISLRVLRLINRLSRADIIRIVENIDPSYVRLLMQVSARIKNTMS